ncbi:ATP-binding protein [Kineococcus glutinatus]|uniref:histidine kinase n=1 Tax=Kineococcus glutinatus TaxID=1070872 RepID=A0ABP9I161_9ACTN
MGGAERVGVEELRSLFLFESLPEEQLAWLAERGERRTFAAGSTAYREGEPAEALFVLLSGRVRLLRAVAGHDETVIETAHRGAYAGAVRAYVDDAEERYPTSLHVVEAAGFYVLPARHFAEFMRGCFPLAVHLLDGLFLGVRATEATVRQREHLARLGTLSAHLAHELNNPAAAAVRATAQLRSRVAGMRHKLGVLAERRVEPATMHRLVGLQERAVELAAKRVELGPVETADREDELADALAGLGVAGGYDLAAVLAAAGLDAPWLTDSIAGLDDPDAAGSAVAWLAYTLETESLMDEIADATERISALVAAVKQYSYVDSAAVQEVDLHVGLDSTVVMLGHKLSGVRVVREYDRSLPEVPAHAAELNQVWTNLIDNAADAMGGSGTLVLRTHRADPAAGDEGEWVCVDVADDGPGIPPQVQPRVFDAFFTTKAQGQGSGLGLDNARRIVVERHHGELSFATGPGGTTFHARLPLRQRLG